MHRSSSINKSLVIDRNRKRDKVFMRCVLRLNSSVPAYFSLGRIMRGSNVIILPRYFGGAMHQREGWGAPPGVGSSGTLNACSIDAQANTSKFGCYKLP